MHQQLTVRRQLSAQEATALVGEKVPELESNVREPVVYLDAESGDPVLAYLPMQPDDRADLRRAVLDIGYSPKPRASGMNSRSRTFGYSPRRPVYGREACAASSLTNEHPDPARVLSRTADIMEDMLRGFAPLIADRDRDVLDETVQGEWRLGEQSLWTSGVINRTSQLPYHRDGFNFPTWSAMPVLRRGMRGGHLHLPEYGLTVACADGYAVFFAGHELVHGVTPMRAARPDGYRYSVVFYALKGMKDCHTAALETEYAARKRTEREREMARKVREGIRLGYDPTIKGKKSGRLFNGQDEEDVAKPPPWATSPLIARGGNRGKRIIKGQQL